MKRVIAACCLALSLLAAPALAEETMGKPLLVVRFQQPVVHYEQSLYMVMSKALEANPNMQFDVVAVAPEGIDQMQNTQLIENSRKYGRDVMASMKQMGMPDSRMRLSSQTSPYVASPEVHVFVY